MELSAAGGTRTAGDRAAAVLVGIVRHCAGYFAAVSIQDANVCYICVDFCIVAYSKNNSLRGSIVYRACIIRISRITDRAPCHGELIIIPHPAA